MEVKEEVRVDSSVSDVGDRVVLLSGNWTKGE